MKRFLIDFGQVLTPFGRPKNLKNKYFCSNFSDLKIHKKKLSKNQEKSTKMVSWIPSILLCDLAPKRHPKNHPKSIQKTTKKNVFVFIEFLTKKLSKSHPKIHSKIIHFFNDFLLILNNVSGIPKASILNGFGHHFWYLFRHTENVKKMHGANTRTLKLRFRRLRRGWKNHAANEIENTPKNYRIWQPFPNHFGFLFVSEKHLKIN